MECGNTDGGNTGLVVPFFLSGTERQNRFLFFVPLALILVCGGEVIYVGE